MATSFSQSEASDPIKVVRTKAKLKMTVMPLQTPTRSDLNRRQAKAHAPSLVTGAD
jgi:predicted RNA polymerase sigma factor